MISVFSGLVLYRAGTWLSDVSVSPLVQWPEPWAALVVLSTAGSWTSALLALLLGRAFGEAGVAAAYTIAMTGVALPLAAWLWMRFRRALVETIGAEPLQGPPSTRA